MEIDLQIDVVKDEKGDYFLKKIKLKLWCCVGRNIIRYIGI